MKKPETISFDKCLARFDKSKVANRDLSDLQADKIALKSVYDAYLAALPDLLEALETSLAACEATQEVMPTDEMPKAIREIRAALTKAGYTFDQYPPLPKP